MVDVFMPVSPLFQAVVNVVLIRVDHASCGNGLSDDGVDRLLLNIGEHFDENFAIALEKTQNWRFFLSQSASSTSAAQFSPPSLASQASNHFGMTFVPSRDVDLVGFDFAFQVDGLFLQRSHRSIGWSLPAHRQSTDPAQQQFVHWKGSALIFYHIMVNKRGKLLGNRKVRRNGLIGE